MEQLTLLWETLLSGFLNSGINTSRIIVSLGLSFVIGIYIFYVYRGVGKNGFYSRTFSIAMGILAPLMSAMVLTMQSSLIISLSSIGALSIIRFRTPIKDPMDLFFLFWSISSGIMCGTGAYEIAILATLMITVGILILSILPVKKSPVLLVLNGSNYDMEQEIIKILKSTTKYYKIKSKNITMSGFDMVIELKTNAEHDMISALRKLDGIYSLSLLEHDGTTRE